MYLLITGGWYICWLQGGYIWGRIEVGWHRASWPIMHSSATVMCKLMMTMKMTINYVLLRNDNFQSWSDFELTLNLEKLYYVSYHYHQNCLIENLDFENSWPLVNAQRVQQGSHCKFTMFLLTLDNITPVTLLFPLIQRKFLSHNARCVKIPDSGLPDGDKLNQCNQCDFASSLASFQPTHMEKQVKNCVKLPRVYQW